MTLGVGLVQRYRCTSDILKYMMDQVLLLYPAVPNTGSKLKSAFLRLLLLQE